MSTRTDLTPAAERALRRRGVVDVPAVDVVATASRPSGARSGRRRSLLTVLAACSIFGFVAVTAGPTGLALAQEDDIVPSTIYEASLAQSQEFEADAELETSVLSRSSYEVYLPPPPEPEPEPEQASSGGGGGGGSSAPPAYTGGGAPAEWMAAAGIAQSDWTYVDYIVTRESGWNPNATNRSSGACGLVQVYPCSKLPNAYDPVVNLGWANGYAIGRYGSWAGAYDFWTRNHWW